MRSFARANGATIFGARAGLVDVQVSAYIDIESNDRAFRIVGLPDSALREGRERIRGAIVHGEWPWPPGPVTVNLAPAATRKEGALLDLPIALGILAAAGVFAERRVLRGWLFLGELGLDGSIRPVRGVLAGVEAARRAGLSRALVAIANAGEAAAVKDVEIVGAPSLGAAVGHLSGKAPLPVERPRPWQPETPRVEFGVRGQEAARKAAEVAASGGHNLLLWGPPGAGKTLLARQIACWLPPLAYEEALEVSRIQSIAGLLDGGLATTRPFRAPHHTTSLAGLVGGGTVPRPGEISLAHLGVLFLDELAEFTRPSLEALRQPVEDGRLVIGRAAGRATFPAEVVLVAAMNPCPCGWRGEKDRCKCTKRDIARYQARISGPLRDRFDLEVRVGPVDAQDLVDAPRDGATDRMDPQRRRRAWKAQTKRAARLRLPRAWNARIPAALLPGAVEPTPEAEQRLVRQARQLGMTGRGVHRVLRVARTIADLAGEPRVTEEHVLQAITYRTA